MRIRLAVLFAFFACCAAPPGEPVISPTAPPPAIDVAGFTRALHAKLQPVGFAAFAAPVPRAAETLTEGQLSIEVEGHLGVQHCRDGSWLVQVPATGARVTKIASAGGPWFAGLNIPGTNNVGLHEMTVRLPLPVSPCDALVLGSGLGGTPSPRPAARWNAVGGTVDEATAVVFVAYPVEGVGPLFCPPAIGSAANPILRGLRGEWGTIPEGVLSWGLLPSIVDLATVYGPGGLDPNAWGATPPTIAGQLASHGKFSGDIYGEWLCAGRVPYTSHSGYGTFFAGDVSTSMLLCCSTLPLEQKQPLVHALCQRAIHDIGRAADGCYLYPSGGHCWGRVPPMVLFGVLSGLDIFANPSPVLGERFPEWNGLQSGLWWTGDAAFNVRWLFSFGDTAGLKDHPSLWGDPNSPTHSTFGWAVGYMAQVIPAQIGSACAIQLLNGERFAPRLVQACRQQMRGPSPAAQAALAAAGNGRLNEWWGKDYAVPFGFAAACWRRYAQ